MQPPKQEAYTQASNPVSQTPQEQRTSAPKTRGYDHAGSSITHRTADSRPSNDEALSQLEAQRKQEGRKKQNMPNVDLEYGVEQQAAEGYIADSVERKGAGMNYAQIDAHADGLGAAAVPGHPGFGEQTDLADHMDQKRAEHERNLHEKSQHDSSSSQYDVAEREAVRNRKMRQSEDMDVKRAAKEATDKPVITYE